MNETKDTDSISACCGRQTGRAVLQDQIARLHRRAHALQTICDMLPAQPTPEQDEALWQIAVELPRN